ncbi:hypothetical protein [Polaribacter sp.]|uniref:hypothetical protein n=1 Tax=Polaribacter sp. TaxID=1920175 RepID=UPI003EF8D0FA
MGSIISAECENCGFKKEFNFGGNMMNFAINNPVPAIHKKSGIFRNVNYFRTQKQANYLYYFEDILKGKNEEGFTFQNYSFRLNEKDNYCPECKNYSFDFILIALTD